MKNTNKLIRLLAIAAVVQFIFIIFTHIGGNTLADHTMSEKILTFDQSKVDKLSIKDKDGQQVELIKKADQWLTQSNFPAINSKVKQLLDKLAGLKHGIPVATSSAALKRFKVADNDFERLITLQQGDKKLASLYLGSGAGARQSHARSDQQSAVYTVELGVYDASAKVEDWQDKNLLQLSKKDVSEINLAGIRFSADASTQKKDSMTVWKAEPLPAGKIVNQKAINDSLNAIATLRFGKVLGKEKKAEYGFDKPALSFNLTHNGKKREYQFAKLKDKDDYALKVTDRDEYLWVPSYTAKSLVEGISKDKWLMEEAKTEPKAEKPKNSKESKAKQADKPIEMQNTTTLEHKASSEASSAMPATKATPTQAEKAEKKHADKPIELQNTTTLEHKASSEAISTIPATKTTPTQTLEHKTDNEAK